VLERPEV